MIVSVSTENRGLLGIEFGQASSFWQKWFQKGEGVGLFTNEENEVNQNNYNISKENLVTWSFGRKP